MGMVRSLSALLIALVLRLHLPVLAKDDFATVQKMVDELSSAVRAGLDENGEGPQEIKEAVKMVKKMEKTLQEARPAPTEAGKVKKLEKVNRIYQELMDSM